jgi:hypothetical protein
VIGDAPYVGVLDVPGTADHLPVRLYFPVEEERTSSSSSSSTWKRRRRRRMPGPAGYFVDGRVVNFLQGYAHVAIAQRDTRLHRWFLRPLL